ncbi:MAG: hypothetical protein K2L95_00725 [Alphaproteobacteria bacterium]|nr:hypothetical protein [Alphaproteobacteria bacterium]
MGRIIRFFVLTLVVVMPAWGAGRDVHALYGAPQMYGEYETPMPTRATLMQMYGTPPASPRPMMAPIVTAPGGDRRPARPPRVAPKQAAKKKTAAAQKPQVKKPALVKKQMPAAQPVASAPDVHAIVVVADAPVVAPDDVPTRAVTSRRRIPVGPKYARGIARHVRNAVDVDAFCEKIRPRPRGPLPDGLILMPGRPDLMCCVE